MRICNTCRGEFNDSSFAKPNGEYFKLCSLCRAHARQQNDRRKEAKSAQAKEYYQQYKNDISKKNKEYREKNKEKLRIYDSSLERKAFHKQWIHKKRQEDPCRFIYYSAKQRSKASGIIFDITKQDVVDIYPSDGKCPIFGMLLVTNVGKTKDDSPSLDRIVPEKGYVKGNIVVISHKANRIKNNATLVELESIVSFLKSKEIK
jgi:hypothetical protein